MRRVVAGIAAALLLAGLAHADPDEDRLGKSQGYPVGNAQSWYSNPYRVGSWSALDPGGVQLQGAIIDAQQALLLAAAMGLDVRASVER